MTIRVAAHLRTLGAVALFAAVTTAAGLAQERPSLTTEADFLRAMEELSNWGRWGADDGLGAANFITPAKRKAAAALVTEGLSISLAHDVIQEDAVDGAPISTGRSCGSATLAPPTGISIPAPIMAPSTAISTRLRAM